MKMAVLALYTSKSSTYAVPFHMGLGLAAKAVAPRLVFLQVFGLAQVAMDVEPAMAMGKAALHGWTHTVWGALPFGLACVFIWRVLESRRL